MNMGYFERSYICRQDTNRRLYFKRLFFFLILSLLNTFRNDRMWCLNFEFFLCHSNTYNTLRFCCEQLFQPVAEVAARSPGDPVQRSQDVPARESVAVSF